MTLYRVMNKTVGSAVATSRGCKKNTGKEIRDREYYTEGENLIFFRTVSTFFCIQFWFVCGYVDGADDPSSDVVSLHPANFFSLSLTSTQSTETASLCWAFEEVATDIAAAATPCLRAGK